MSIVRDKVNSVSGNEIGGIIGDQVDLETVLAFKDLLNRLGCENIDIRSDAPRLNADFRNQYLMNSRISGIDETDLLLLIGCNPRFEAPVLNARIRKAYL